jgi:hypothetical protein
MFRIRRFNVIKTSTVVALMYMLIIAVIVVPFLLLFAVAGVSVNGGPTQGGGVIAILGLGVFLILFYGLLGWVFTAIACLLYNVVAGWVGGIEVQVEAVVPPAPPPAWLAPGAPPPGPPIAPPSDPTAPPPTAPPPTTPVP